MATRKAPIATMVDIEQTGAELRNSRSIWTDTVAPEGRARRTQYRVAYAEAFVAHCRSGKGVAEFAERIGVSIETIISWIAARPAFAEAAARAEAALYSVLERRALDSEDAAEIDPLLAKLEVLAPESWADPDAPRQPTSPHAWLYL